MIISNVRRVIQQEPGVYRLGLLSSSSLYMDFAGGFGVSLGVPSSAASLLTTTRASNGYSDDTAGNWTLFGSGVPRITNKGLLVEESRTNSIRNNSMQGAVAGTPGTNPTNWSATTTLANLTKTITAAGTSSGIDYVDITWAGTTNATSGAISFDGSQVIAALQNQVWTGSVFLSITVNSGATPVIRTRISERDAAGGALTSNDSGTLSVTTALTRFSQTATLGNASTAFALPQIVFTFVDATAYNFTLRIGWPQLELGAFATSPIRTTSAAATRAADAITTAVASSGGNPFTLFARGTPNAPTTFGTNQVLAQIDDGTANNRAIFIRSLTTGALSVFETISGAATAATPAGTWAQSASGKIAIAVGSSEIAAAFNGGTVATGSPVGIATVNALRIGATNSPGAFWNGYIERVAFFPTRLTNAQLQAITAP